MIAPHPLPNTRPTDALALHWTMMFGILPTLPGSVGYAEPVNARPPIISARAKHAGLAAAQS